MQKPTRRNEWACESDATSLRQFFGAIGAIGVVEAGGAGGAAAGFGVAPGGVVIVIAAFGFIWPITASRNRIA